MKIIIRDTPKLYEKSPLEQFLGIPPYDDNAISLSRDRIAGRQFPRTEISDILINYNQSIGNDVQGLENVKKLAAEDSVCVIGGQQLGMFGGPSYTILKIISTLMLAKEADAIPIFWVATEDHDVDEINHSYLLDPMGDLKKFQLFLPRDRRFVEELELSDKDFKVISAFQEFAHLPTVSNETSYSRYMIKQLLPLFAGTGLVFLEPRLLRPLATSFFQKEIADCDAINRIINNTSEKLVTAGSEKVIDVSSGSNLFIKVDEKYRCKIHRKENGFQIAGKEYSTQELMNLIKNKPMLFSTNAAARPVLQSLLLPTLAYVAGPSEIKYHYQLGDYFGYHGIQMHWIVPRISATMITPQAEKLLRESKLNPWDELPQRSFHYVRNLLHPHEKLQERVLNWWTFQSTTKENIVNFFLENVSWKTQGHLYCFLD